jgi:ubiquinone/menaquinone biosynthesis C-methylase UbiE
MMKKIKKNSHEKRIYRDYYVNEDSGQTLRYKWYKDKFFKKIVNKTILEIGCGDGGVVQYLKEKNEVHGADISKNGVKFIEKKGIKTHLVDISEEKLKVKDGFFDYVIILETIEHLKSPQHAIEEIQRVLKKNGVMIISIPNPRTCHKFLYPCLFKFKNFKEYLINNRFLVKRVDTYGICPPFWKYIKSRFTNKWQKQKKNLNTEKDKITFLSRTALLFSYGFLAKIKPKRYSWSFIYECINTNPTGARDIYTEIAKETRGAYN